MFGNWREGRGRVWKPVADTVVSLWAGHCAPLDSVSTSTVVRCALGWGSFLPSLVLSCSFNVKDMCLG